MRAILVLGSLLLMACTGSPDSVTLYGGRGTALYDDAAGNAAFSEVGYSYGVGLTWSLPTKRSMLEDERGAQMLELMRALERDAHDSAQIHPVGVTVSPVSVESPRPVGEDENSITAKTKAILGLAAAGLAVAVTAAVKRVVKFRRTAGARKKADA